MAMVTARRGQHIVRVSKHSYETLFRNKEYRIVEDEKEVKPKQETDMNVGQVVDYGELEKQEVETVPISEMNKEQLAEYAKEHNIDTSGARNVREARQIIQKAIRESKM